MTHSVISVRGGVVLNFNRFLAPGAVTVVVRYARRATVVAA